MPREIIIQPRPRAAREELERRARLLLETGADNGDDAVLGLAINIAFEENLDVVFRVGENARAMPPAVAVQFWFDHLGGLRR